LYGIVKKDLKPEVNKYAHCKIANQCKVDGYTFFVIAEGGKKWRIKAAERD
jgi:hypothetical protein